MVGKVLSGLIRMVVPAGKTVHIIVVEWKKFQVQKMNLTSAMLNENTKVVGWWVMVEIDMDKLFQIFSFKIVQAVSSAHMLHRTKSTFGLTAGVIRNYFCYSCLSDRLSTLLSTLLHYLTFQILTDHCFFRRSWCKFL